MLSIDVSLTQNLILKFRDWKIISIIVLIKF